MTLKEAFEMIERGETPEAYEKRCKKIRRLANERDDLEDAISVLADGNHERDKERLETKKKRLEKVLKQIDELL